MDQDQGRVNPSPAVIGRSSGPGTVTFGDDPGSAGASPPAKIPPQPAESPHLPSGERDPSHVSLSPSPALHFDAQPDCATKEALLSQITADAGNKSMGSEGGGSLPVDVPIAEMLDVFASNASSRTNRGGENGSVPLSSSSRVGAAASVSDAAEEGAEESATSMAGGTSPGAVQTWWPSALSQEPSVAHSARTDEAGGSSKSTRAENSGGDGTGAAGKSERQHDKELLRAFRRLRGTQTLSSLPADFADEEESTPPAEGSATGSLAGKEAVIGSILQLLQWSAAPFQGVSHQRRRRSTQIFPGPPPQSIAASTPSEDRAIFLADPVHITSSAVEVMLERVATDAQRALQAEERQRATAKEGQKKSASLFGDSTSARSGVVSHEASVDGVRGGRAAPKVIPAALPSVLDMPIGDRCAFCQKHDSMCARDHQRWSAIKATTRERIAATAYAALPRLKRRAILFLTAAYGCGSFVAMQLLHEKEQAAFMTCHFVCPMALVGTGEAQAQELLGDAGAVHPLHVAAAFRNSTVMRALLDSPFTLILPSPDGVDPLDWLDDAALGALAKLPTVHTHLLHAGVVWGLVRGDGAWTDEMLRELATHYPTDPCTKWWHACQLLLRGRPEECILECEALLTAADTCSRLAPSAVQGLVSLASASLRATPAPPPTPPPPTTTTQAARLPSPSPPCVEVHRSLPLRRLPFRVIRDGVMPFCDPQSLWHLYSASRAPLLRRACETATRGLTPTVFTGVLMRMPGFVELLGSIETFQPTPEECAALPVSATHPVKPLGVLVTGVDGFHLMIVKVSATGHRAVPANAPPRRKRTVAELLYDALVSSGDESGEDIERRQRHARDGAALMPEDAVEVIVSRQFRIDRGAMTEPWRVRPVDRWAVDMAATKKLSVFFKSRTSPKA